jgi:hypothetical protein
MLGNPLVCYGLRSVRFGRSALRQKCASRKFRVKHFRTIQILNLQYTSLQDNRSVAYNCLPVNNFHYISHPEAPARASVNTCSKMHRSVIVPVPLMRLHICVCFGRESLSKYLTLGNIFCTSGLLPLLLLGPSML